MTRPLRGERPSEHITHYNYIINSHLQTTTQSEKEFDKERTNVFVMQEHPNMISVVYLRSNIQGTHWELTLIDQLSAGTKGPSGP